MKEAFEAFVRQYKYNQVDQEMLKASEIADLIARRRSHVDFEVSPHYGDGGLGAFTLGCIHCNIGIELDIFGASTPKAMQSFFIKHEGCKRRYSM